MMNNLFIQLAHDHLNIAKWLLEIKPTLNISVDDDYIFRFACENIKIELAQWLVSINTNYNIVIVIDYMYRGNNTIYYDIQKPIEIKKTLPIHSDIIQIICLEEEDKECIICKHRTINLQTNCKHNFCTECISEWYGLHQSCPYCRANINTCNTIVIA